MTQLDIWRLTDGEVGAMIRALDATERSAYGQRLLEELITSAITRQAKQAADEGWHVGHEYPAAPDWSTS